jgi:Tfp pilus assembly protein FimV
MLMTRAGGMAKHPSKMTLDELAQEMSKAEDSLDHLMARAEIMRRQTQAQLNACAAQIDAASAEREAALSAAATARSTEKTVKYLLTSVILASAAALGSAVSAYFAYHAALNTVAP